MRRHDPHRHFRLALRAVARRRSIRRTCRSGASSSTRRGSCRTIEINGSFYSLQTARVLRSAGTTRRPPASCSASRAAATSRTCGGCATSSAPLAQLLRVGHCEPAREARAVPVAAPAELRVRSPSASRHSSSCCRATPTPRRARAPSRREADRRARIAFETSRPLRHAIEVRHRRSSTRFVACCAARRRVRRRRHRGQVAARRGRDGGLRLRPPARRREALRERLHEPRSTLGARIERWSAGRAADAAYRAGVEAGGRATSSSTSTTTSR